MKIKNDKSDMIVDRAFGRVPEHIRMEADVAAQQHLDSLNDVPELNLAALVEVGRAV